MSNYDGRFPEPPYETEMDKDERIAELEQKVKDTQSDVTFLRAVFGQIADNWE